jgi:hypothetical protein
MALEAKEQAMRVECFRILMFFAGGDVSNVVDIYNARSGVWTTAIFSVVRRQQHATSLPNDGLAIFGGGISGAIINYF